MEAQAGTMRSVVYRMLLLRRVLAMKSVWQKAYTSLIAGLNMQDEPEL
jgi:hypothetical protein